ncbi:MULTISPECIES: hypothetical protein [unclassified Fusobacterium]|uniref:hypothetical protein n=1 Tax=unclassified Fusobacterium TaxID=2648384 RepID=UPI001B8B5159|nr:MULTISPECIES: hypothetical protein [unclassified Fusobacterium]MBR8702213.1 hypothetical protein [Fusobacterium sp. DD45]MBR8712030.1 hypothetical protein [Fusobacterium sp. DD28]MBR8752608.1 hypothetical protein [Fusobacterium sp. DD26]
MEAMYYKNFRNTAENRAVVLHNNCDRYDFLASVGCGGLAGFIDVFFVGDPKDSLFLKYTDKAIDETVKKFAQFVGWDGKGNDSVKSAIGYLERKFKVNYDQRLPSDVNNAFDILPKTHHMMNLAHSPDIIGLFFSILNQFTSTSSFVVEGQVITVDTETYELQGNTFVTKIICGTINWFGHIMSDIAGSSGSHGRGTGIVMPFYELFGFCKFGSFDVNGAKMDLAELAQEAFTQGEDFRFGLAQAIPVAIVEILIRVIWAVRRRIQYKLPLKDCIPKLKYGDLRMMLIVGEATLCVTDLVDALIKSKFGVDKLKLFMRLNLIAWLRLILLVLKEILLRFGFSFGLDAAIENFREINEALYEQLNELEKIDLNAYHEECKKYMEVKAILTDVTSEEELHSKLLLVYDQLEIEKPYEGNFDDFMRNKDQKFIFK